MFEVVINRLLGENGYTKVNRETPGFVKIERRHFVEFKGRGAWHQIDSPFDYNSNPPFLNPIRLLGEVKFYESKIDKSEIREYIGVIKDIQENCFVNNIDEIQKPRFTELGVFFSASGFKDSAEMLAYTHNIKTISYENVELIRVISELILQISKNYLLPGRCVSRGRQADFIDSFNLMLSGEIPEAEFANEYSDTDGAENIFTQLRESLQLIQSNFVANTNAGVYLHFVSSSTFPDELFENTDNQNISIHFSLDNFDNRRFWLRFIEDHQERRFYFKPPLSLREAAFFGGVVALNEKERAFREIRISRNIGGINRNLSLTLDNDWLENARREIQ